MTTAEQLVRLGAAHAEARGWAEQLRGELRDAVVKALTEGMSESEAARLSGVTRMTVRAWAGKK